MKVIFIRGVPGVGKTLVSEALKKIFLDAEVIGVDKFKLKAMKNGEDFDKSKKFAYEQTLKKLELFYKKNKDYVIIEEIICDQDFLNRIYEFLDKTKSQSYWFRLKRKIKELLETEAKRKRRIKNTKEDLFKLKQDIESCKIKNEYSVKNDNLALTIKKILEIVI